MNQKTRQLFLIVLAVALLGWCNSLYTLWHHVKLFTEGLTAPSFCSISSAVNCDKVALSSYSHFLGWPTAGWAMLHGFAIILLAGFGWTAASEGKTQQAGVASRLLLILSLVALVPTLFLLGVSVTVIGSICLMCTITYVVNIALAVLSFQLKKSVNAACEAGSCKAFFTPALVGIFALGLGFHALLPTVMRSSIAGDDPLNDKDIELAIQTYVLGAPKDIPLENTPSKGAANAKVTLVEFSDYQCPYCARFSASLAPLLAMYPNDLRIVHKNFPLNSQCNAAVKQEGHPLACVAAKAGHCVFKTKGNENFFAYSEEVFQSQAGLTPEKIKEIAAKHGLAESDFDICQKDSNTHQAVMADGALGEALGVNSTPTVYINGHKVGQPLPRVVRAMIEYYLKGGK